MGWIYRGWTTWLLTAAGVTMAAPAAARSDEAQDLTQLSIEELAQIPVRSASKHEEPLSAAPTSLYVITDADIQRSPATSIPELLRQAPNLTVQRLSTRDYAITARGFNGAETANKLLVLIDGRSVYSTLHSGVFWELHAPLMEDVQQVEVISGPGGTLYGPNAVNGVINITSRDARDSVGLIARGSGGANEWNAGARYGVRLGEDAAIRVYGNYYDREDSPGGAAPDLDDGLRGWQAGFRLDAGAGESQFTLQGDAFDQDTFMLPGDGNHGHNLIARWRSPVSDSATFQLQGYYDYFKRRALLAEDSLQTIDVEGLLDLKLGAHQIVAGLGARTTQDRFVNTLNAFALDPARQRLWVLTGFVQDRFFVAPEVSVTAGIKVERSSYSGVELLPNLRLAWQATPSALFWAAVSRAVRTPSRIDRDLNAPGILARAPDFVSEKLVAFEAGFRGQPTAGSSFAITGFYNRYEDLRSLRLIPGPRPIQLANELRGESYGIEAWGSHQMTSWWRLSAGASMMAKEFEAQPGKIDLGQLGATGDDPEYQFQLRSQLTLPEGVSFDLGLRAIGPLDRSKLDAYAEAEARIGWMVSERIELFVAGTDLLHDTHRESADVQRAQAIERSILAGTRLRF